MRKFISLAAATAAAVTLVLAGAVPVSAQPQFDLIAKHASVQFTQLPDTATSNSGAATLDGFRGWRQFLDNESATPVTNSTVTIESGYDPSLFDWNGPVTAFPASMSLPSLAPGSTWFPGSGLTSTIPAQFSASYDSTRTVDTTTIPVGGGQQTLTVTVTPTDPRYEDPSLVGQFNIMVDSALPGVTVASSTGPSNLNQGEELNTPTPPPGNLFWWQLVGNRPHQGKQYTFSLVLNVPNPHSAPIPFRPGVHIDGALEAQLSDVTGSQASFSDPTLDGGSTGRGGSVFQVNESTHTWTRYFDQAANIIYPSTDTYPFTGYQPPVDNPPVLNQVNGGQAIPMKFSLGGNYGLNIIAPGYRPPPRSAAPPARPLTAARSPTPPGAAGCNTTPAPAPTCGRPASPGPVPASSSTCG